MLCPAICQTRHCRAVVSDERGAATSRTRIECGLSRDHTVERDLGVFLEVMKDDRSLRTPADSRITGLQEHPRRMVRITLEIAQEGGEIGCSRRVLEAGNELVARAHESSTDPDNSCR